MQRWRKLLLPFSWLYSAIVSVRNFLYDLRVFKSVSYNLPVICIGNLSVGGTGKTPMTEYVARLLYEKCNVAILSRGYKRATKGYVLAKSGATAKSIGDEPFQYFSKLKGVSIAVDGDRRHGIEMLRKDVNPDVVVLDDAFQHRKVKAGLNILLTMYGDLYVDDIMLPAGNLRDTKAQAKRADIIVVTKCPAQLTEEEKKHIMERLKLKPEQKIYFSTILYVDRVFGKRGARMLTEYANNKVTLVTGIAHPEPLLRYMNAQGIDFRHIKYPDHHNFSLKEIRFLKQQKNIITTEKDFVRLAPHIEELYYLPIEVSLLDNVETFNEQLLDFVMKKG